MKTRTKILLENVLLLGGSAWLCRKRLQGSPTGTRSPLPSAT